MKQKLNNFKHFTALRFFSYFSKKIPVFRTIGLLQKKKRYFKITPPLFFWGGDKSETFFHKNGVIFKFFVLNIWSELNDMIHKRKLLSSIKQLDLRHSVAKHVFSLGNFFQLIMY